MEQVKKVISFQTKTPAHCLALLLPSLRHDVMQEAPETGLGHLVLLLDLDEPCAETDYSTSISESYCWSEVLFEARVDHQGNMQYRLDLSVASLFLRQVVDAYQ